MSELYQGQYSEPAEQPLSVGEWIVTIIVLAIPCVGFIMMLVWGFGNGNTSRKNYCRATLILAVIGAVLAIILYVIMGAAIASMLSGAM